MPGNSEPTSERWREVETEWRYRSAAWENIKPGDRISFECNGQIHTDVVTSINYSNGQPEVVRHLNWWQRVARWLTPSRCRKSGKPATVFMRCGGGDEPLALGKTLDQIAQMKFYREREGPR